MSTDTDTSLESELKLEDPTKVVFWDKAKCMEALGDDEEVLLELMGDAVTQMDTELPALASLIVDEKRSEADLDKMIFKAHALKASARGLHFKVLGAVTMNIESIGKYLRANPTSPHVESMFHSFLLCFAPLQH